jgi:spore germination protein KB
MNAQRSLPVEKTNKIGVRETLTFLVVVISGKVFLTLPRNLILRGGSAGWLIILLAGGLSLLGLQILSALIRKYPGENIFEIARRLTGKYCGAGLGLLIFGYFLLNSAVLTRQFAESFILAILPRTPISVITLIFLILLMYAALLGIETLTRVAWFFGPYLLIALLTIFIFALPTEPQYLAPILGPGPLPILKYSFGNLAGFSEIILLGILAPLIRKQSQIYFIGLFSLIIATIIITGVTTNIIMTFNPVSASRLVFPVFHLTRLISLGEFIQRTESVFVFLWFFTAGVQISGLFYGTVVSFSETFEIKEYRPLVFPLAALIFMLSLLPQSMTEVNQLESLQFYNFYSIIAFGIPGLLWLISLMLRQDRGGAADE